MINLENNFFGRVANKMFDSSVYYYENSFKDANAYPEIKLVLSVILLFAGKIFFFISRLEMKFYTFLKRGGIFLVTAAFMFCCYILSLELLKT